MILMHDRLKCGTLLTAARHAMIAMFSGMTVEVRGVSQRSAAA